MEGCGRLRDILTGATGELFANVLDHFPLTRRALERFGDGFTQFCQLRRSTAAAGGGTRHNHAFARQVFRKRFSNGLAADVSRNGRLTTRPSSPFSSDLVLRGARLEFF